MFCFGAEWLGNAPQRWGMFGKWSGMVGMVGNGGEWLGNCRGLCGISGEWSGMMGICLGMVWNGGEAVFNSTTRGGETAIVSPAPLAKLIISLERFR